MLHRNRNIKYHLILQMLIFKLSHKCWVIHDRAKMGKSCYIIHKRSAKHKKWNIWCSFVPFPATTTTKRGATLSCQRHPCGSAHRTVEMSTFQHFNLFNNLNEHKSMASLCSHFVNCVSSPCNFPFGMCSA